MKKILELILDYNNNSKYIWKVYKKKSKNNKLNTQIKYKYKKS